MNDRVSHISHSSFMTPFSQRAIVTISILNGLPVGLTVLPSAVGMGWVNVPSSTPVTAVQLPSAIFTGWRNICPPGN